MSKSRLLCGCVVLTLMGCQCVGEIQAQNNNRRQVRAQNAHGRGNGPGNMNPMAQNMNNMNNAMAAQGVQMLLGRFDANNNGALDGQELVAVAAAFQRLMMMAQNGGQGMGRGGLQGGQGMGQGGPGMGRGGFQFGQGPPGNMHGGQGARGGMGGGMGGGGRGGMGGGMGGGGRGGGRR